MIDYNLLLQQLANPDTLKAAEATLNAQFDLAPDAAVLAILSQAVENDDEATRIFALVLVRRLTFKAVPDAGMGAVRRLFWDDLAEATRSRMKETMLGALRQAEKRRENERGAICDLVSSIEKSVLDRAGTWPELATILSQLFTSPALALREATFRIYAEVPALLEAEPPNAVVQGLSSGLRDESPGVRISALLAATRLLADTDANELSNFARLVPIMLDVLPPLAETRSEERLTKALIALIDMMSTPKLPARLMKPHLSSILAFCLSIISPSPSPISPTFSATPFSDGVRSTALELLISMAEGAPKMTNATTFADKVVPLLLSLMSERTDDNDWISQEDLEDDIDEDSISVVAEDAIDRLAIALQNDVFEPFTKQVEGMINSPHWQHRHSVLSGWASIFEGTVEEVHLHVSEIIPAILPSLKDQHPRVRYAAIYALGQLCTDLEGVAQDKFGLEIIKGFMGTMHDSVPRIQAYSAAACINWLSEIRAPEVVPVLPELFEHLLTLIERGAIFVKIPALESMANTAACVLKEFIPYYPRIMPQLLQALEIVPTTAETITLRAKYIDCTSCIAEAVGAEVFQPDADRLLAAYRAISVQTLSPEDDETPVSLDRSYAKLTGVLVGDRFRPYFHEVFPRLLDAATSKSESDYIISPSEEQMWEEGWETIEDDGGQTIAVKSAALERKEEAVRNLNKVVEVAGDYLAVQAIEMILEAALPLLQFYFNVTVRESTASLIWACADCLSRKDLPIEQRQVIFAKISDALSHSITVETDSHLLTALLISWSTSLAAFRGFLSPNSREIFVKALESQLTLIAERDHVRCHMEDFEDPDDEMWDEDSYEDDAMIVGGISQALRQLLKSEGPATPIQPLLPFLALANSTNVPIYEFGLRFICDLVKYAGEASYESILPYLNRIIECLQSEHESTRRIAAYIVGVCVDSSPTIFVAFGLASIEPLFRVIGDEDASSLGKDELLARDNALGAICKILRKLGEDPKVQEGKVLERWIKVMPALDDTEEAETTYSLLLELIARGHESVSPTGPAAAHVAQCLVSALKSSDVASLHKAIAQALRTYAGAMPDGGVALEIPADVQVQVGELLKE